MHTGWLLLETPDGRPVAFWAPDIEMVEEIDPSQVMVRVHHDRIIVKGTLSGVIGKVDDVNAALAAEDAKNEERC